MEASTEFYSLIKKSKKVLLIVPEQSSFDQLSAAFATWHFLRKLEKEPALLLKNQIPAQLEFLEKPEDIIGDLTGSRDFLLLFDTKHNKITSLKSEKREDQFIVRITPEKGRIDPRDFSFVPADFNYDLALIFGVPALEALGSIYQDNTDLFFEVPKVNLDNHTHNENFGQVNLVDMTASSICEICAELFLEKENLINKATSQALLTGIISQTNSFQKSTTTPQTMLTAAKLMKLKADQPEIIRYLYKTKSLSFLKLWGRIMARLEFDPKLKFSWSLIGTEDFVQSKSNESDVPFILEEVKKNFSKGQIFGIFFNDTTGHSNGLFYFLNHKLAQKLAKIYNIETTNGKLEIKFSDKNILEAEKDFLKKILSV